MPDALIAVLIVVVSAVVLALPRGVDDVPAAELARVRRRQVVRAVAGAIAVSLWPALTWHGYWWLGPATGLAMLSGYLFAIRRPPAAGPRRAGRERPAPGAYGQGERRGSGAYGQEQPPLRASSPPAP